MAARVGETGSFRVTADDFENPFTLWREQFKSDSTLGLNLDRSLRHEIREYSVQPYERAAHIAASRVVIFGDAGFLNTSHDPSVLSSQNEANRREKMLAALTQDVETNASDSIAKPIWATTSAADYITLTGEKCWSSDYETLMIEDGMTFVKSILKSNSLRGTLTKSRLDIAAAAAASCKLISGADHGLGKEFNNAMASATLSEARLLWESGPNDYGAHTSTTARRIADARILMASSIVTIQNNANKGIELQF